MYILYNVLLLVAAIIVLPYYLLKIIFTGKYRQSLIPKLGGRQAKILANLKNGPRVWIHAVSVGEVTAAAPIAASLKIKRPDIEIIFSTSTETGQEMARRLIPGAAAFIYFPLDIPSVVRKSINLVNPDAFVMVETELWPNFLKACKSKKIKTLMVNGRFSLRSYGKFAGPGSFGKKFLMIYLPPV